jgi:hypothetical protein
MAALAEPVYTVDVFNGTSMEHFGDDTLTSAAYSVSVQQEQEYPTFTGLPILAVVNPLNLALAPLLLSEDEAQELDNFLEHPRALPTLPIQRVPRGDRSRLSRKMP